MHAKSLQSCPTLCNPMDCSPPGSSVYEIVQARILEWVVMPFSRGSFQPTGTEPVSPCSSCIPGRFFYQGSHQESFPPRNPQINYVWVLGGFSCVPLFVTLWTVAHQAPLSMGFSRQEYCSGLSCPSPGDLPDPGVELASPALQVVSRIVGRFFTSEPVGKPTVVCGIHPQDEDPSSQLPAVYAA